MGTKVFFPKAVEHLAAEELDIVSGKPKQNIKKKRLYWNIGVTFVRWQKTQLDIFASVALCLLSV